MPFSVLFLTVDPFIGRIDYASLPQQTLMEMFIDGIENRQKICGNIENPKDIEEWEGVTLNENEEVAEINWGGLDLERRINLEWIPSSVQTLRMYANKLTGSIDLTSLPENMKELYLTDNKLSGEIDLSRLPEGMEVLALVKNELSGSISLKSLPAGMKRLFLSKNNFTGETDFGQLPKSLTTLHVGHTQLSGDFCDRRVRFLETHYSNVTDLRYKLQTEGTIV